jgi:hypothetical protein
VNIARKPPPTEPPSPDDDNTDALATAVAVITGMQAELDAANRDKTRMQRTIDEVRYWRRQTESAAQAAKPDEVWFSLKAAAIYLVGIEPRDYERVREWCVSGKVVCRKRGERGELWEVEMNSGRQYATSRGISPPSY